MGSRDIGIGVFLFILSVTTKISGQLTATPGQEQAADRQLANLYFDSTHVTWKEAASACTRNRNGSLLPVTTATADTQLISKLKQKYHVDDVWVGDNMAFNGTFIPLDGYVWKTTDICVALTIASMTTTVNSTIIVMYDLNIQTECAHALRAMCVCRQGSGSVVLKVKTDEHGWSHYRNSQCGFNCNLWAPPYNKVTPGDLDPVVGKGQVELGGLNSDIQVGTSYWVNVATSSVERPGTGLGSIIKCGYIQSYVGHVVFGSCNERKGFMCETGSGEGTENDTSTLPVDNGITPTSPSSTDLNTKSPLENNQTETDLQTSGGLSTIGYAGIIGGSVTFIVLCVGLVAAWKIRRDHRGNKEEEILPKGGRSFMRPKPDPEQSNVHSTQEDNRMTLYSKIDPSHVRNTLRPATNSRGNQVDKKVTADGGGYLPMDGAGAGAMLNDAYDVIGKHGRRTVDSGYDELHRNPSNVYSVSSMEADSDSIYDTTLDRHPSKRALIQDDSYARLDMSWSASMDDRMCNSVNVEDDGYSNHRTIKMQNPTYDRVTMEKV